MVNWKYDPIRKDYYDIHNPTLRATRIDKPGYVYSGATISKGKTFASSETVTNTKLHTLVDAATISDIVNADIASGAAIDESKISFDGASSSAVLVGAYDQIIGGTKSFSNAPNLPTDSIDAITEIASALKSGLDSTLITGTAGTDGNLAEWNADGDVVGSSKSTSDFIEASVDNTTVEVSGGTLQVKDSGISQAKLKTSTGSVSVKESTSIKTLPGGTYGFFPQIRLASSDSGPAGAFVGHNDFRWDTPYEATAESDPTDYSYGSYVTMTCSPQSSGYDRYIYAQQRYITSSGPDHWIFLLRDKDTGDVKGGYSAPDHPEYGQGETDIRKLLGAKDNEEIILVDNKILKEIKDKQTTNRDILTIINEEYEIHDKSRPKYKTREIIEIDEFGDKKGKTIKKMKTPQWAKIAITKEEIELKKREVKKDYLEKNNIKYKKLKRK